jgi:hypothetical protein
MKKLFFGFLIFMASLNLNAQSVFLDALFLNRYVEKVADNNFQIYPNDTVFLIWCNYFNDFKSNSSTANDANKIIDANPFFKGFEYGGPPHGKAGSIKTSLATLGDFDITNIALGLTDFLIERTKTELNTAFFMRMKNELKDDKYNDLKTLFPKTIAVLEVIDIEIYQYDLYLNSMRNAFEKDLHSMLDNLPAVLDAHKDEILKIDPKLFSELKLSLQFAKWISENKHPGEILKLLSEDEDLYSINDTLASAIGTIALFSESFRDIDATEHYWVAPSALKKLKDETTLRIYLGLLLQECKNKESYKRIKVNINNDFKYNGKVVLNAGKHNIADVLTAIGENWNEAKSEYEAIRDFIIQFSENVNNIDRAIRNVKEVQKIIMANNTLSSRERNKMLFDAYYDLYGSTIELVEYSENVENLPFLKGNFIFPQQAKVIINYFEDAGEICVQVAHKQYVGAVANIAIFLSNFMKGENQQTLQKFLKYGSFMAALVEAETPEDAKRAIESVALPPGSYSIKRESRFSVALNGYVGVFAGHEYIKNVTNKTVVNNYAITAPIGFSFSWGNIQRKDKRPWSIGGFISLIDLGAVASYRFGAGSDTVKTVPTIQLKHLLAPGLFAEFGIGGTPLTLGVGAQMGPRLRKVGDNANEVGDMYWRFGASLKVDIPIFNLYAGPGGFPKTKN